MHKSSFHLMRQFSQHLQKEYEGKNFKVLDVGSMGVNGTYKELFSFPGVEYTGLDISTGPNVDIVPKDPYHWKEIKDHSFDIIISGQALEHVEYPWLIADEIARILKPGARAYLIAPSRGPQHRYPVDCYRYYPDGLKALAKWAGLEVLDSGYYAQTTGFTDGSDNWGDCHILLRKPEDKKVIPEKKGHKKTKPEPLQLAAHNRNPLRRNKTSNYYDFERKDAIDLLVKHAVRPESVLELGCSSGATGRAIKKSLGVSHYVGIEKFPDAAKTAGTRLDAVHEADIETATGKDLGLKKNEFDLLVALDVLEHLYNPWDVLFDLTYHLKPGAHVLVSIPNLQNAVVIRDLANGHFKYANAGLLDATHIRFFTRETVEELLTGAGLDIVGSSRIYNPALPPTRPGTGGYSIGINNLKVTDVTEDNFHSLFTYQFLYLARKPA